MTKRRARGARRAGRPARLEPSGRVAGVISAVASLITAIAGLMTAISATVGGR